MDNYIISTITQEQKDVLGRLCQKAAIKDKPYSSCEVGCFTGESTSVFGNQAKKRNEIHYAIDWFKGTPTSSLTHHLYGYDIFLIFILNLRKLGLTDAVNTLHMTSEEAANILKDNLFNIIFIDGDHRYKGIKRDIELFYPKLKKGGILCGHDYDCHPNKAPFDITKHLDVDCYEQIHCGVIHAVNKKFGKPETKHKIWWIEKHG